MCLFHFVKLQEIDSSIAWIWRKRELCEWLNFNTISTNYEIFWSKYEDSDKAFTKVGEGVEVVTYVQKYSCASSA